MEEQVKRDMGQPRPTERDLRLTTIITTIESFRDPHK